MRDGRDDPGEIPVVFGSLQVDVVESQAALHSDSPKKVEGQRSDG